MWIFADLSGCSLVQKLPEFTCGEALSIPWLLLRLGDRFRSVWKICEKVETGGVVGLGDSSFIVPVIPAPQHFLHSLILKVVFIMCSAIFVWQDGKQFDWCCFARNPNIRKIYGGGDCLKSQIFLSENRKSASGLVLWVRSISVSRGLFGQSGSGGECVSDAAVRLH